MRSSNLTIHRTKVEKSRLVARHARTRRVRLRAGLIGVAALFMVLGCAPNRIKVRLSPPSHEAAWGEARHNQANTAFVAGPAQIPDVLLWEAKTSGEVRAELTADRGVIVAPCWDGRLYFFDAETGKRVHREEFKGPPTSVVFAGDSLAFAVTGKKSKFFLWDIPHETELAGKHLTHAAAPPLRLSDGWLIGTLSGDLFKLKAEGETAWSHQFTAPFLAKPALRDNHVFLVTGGKRVSCLDTDSGTVIWDHSSAGGHAASPAVDEMVYFGSLDSNFYALAIETGEMRWFFHTGGQVFTSPAVDQQRVYFGSNDGIFYALDKWTGRLVWKLAAGLVHNSSPVVWGSTVVFGTSDGQLLIVEAVSGEIIRHFQTRGSIYSPPIIYRDKIYVTDTKRRLYCFGIPPESP